MAKWVTHSPAQTDTKAATWVLTSEKWGALASFLLPVASIIAPLIFLLGNLRDTFGPFSYDLADFLSGPLWAASLVALVFALRERIGERAPRRMSLALLAAGLAAVAMVSAACVRSANRHYHLIHPELHLEESTSVLVVWTTTLAGLTAAARHFQGWAWLLIGSAAWTTRSLPRGLSALYLMAGTASAFAYLRLDLDEAAAALGVIVCIWQGILLWRAKPGEARALEEILGQLDRA